MKTFGSKHVCSGIATDNSNHRVGHCISIFTTDGQFVCYFEGHGSNVDHFDSLYELTFDKKDICHIFDRSNKRLVMYYCC